jgi:hypothetical protein
MHLWKLSIIYSMFFLLMVSACKSRDGKGWQTDGDTGTVAGTAEDMKPVSPSVEASLFVTFENTLIHKSGNGRISFPLVATPYTFDLLQFKVGDAAQRGGSAKIYFGKYTRAQISVSDAVIRFDNNSITEENPVVNPFENSKIDNRFIYNPSEDSENDYANLFDLSKSVVVIGTSQKPPAGLNLPSTFLTSH